MTYHIIDTETASIKGGVCEIAWLEVDNDLNVIRDFCTLVDPQTPIEEGAMKVHGITNEDVYGMPTIEQVLSSLPKSITQVSHNVSFDYRMLKSGMEAAGIEVAAKVCTLKLAREHIKHTTNHKLETLQLELEFPKQKSHSALGDVYTCRDLLLYLHGKHGVMLDSVIARQGIPKLVHTMPFGKHKGKPIVGIPKDYREWLLKQELEDDLRFTLESLKNV